MSRSLLIAGIFLCAGATSVEAQDWAARMFETGRHDFGKVARGATCEYLFKFNNPYVEDVHVASVRSSCGCTTPKVTVQTLKTYEESAIVAHFNTDTFLGQRSATLTVTFDKPYYAEVQLQVSGYIRSDVVLSPPGVNFGTLDMGQVAERTIDVSYAGRSDWRIVGAKSTSPHLEADVEETGRSGNQVRYRLNVRLKEGAPGGYLKDQVILQTTDARAPELPVDVEGRLAAPLTISPASVFLGVVQPGQKVTKQIVVQGRKPFKIVGCSCPQSCFEFKTTDKSAVVHLVPITYVATNDSGNVNYKIQIKTDLGETIVGTVSAYAQITAPQASAQLQKN